MEHECHGRDPYVNSSSTAKVPFSIDGNTRETMTADLQEIVIVKGQADALAASTVPVLQFVGNKLPEVTDGLERLTLTLRERWACLPLEARVEILSLAKDTAAFAGVVEAMYYSAAHLLSGDLAKTLAKTIQGYKSASRAISEATGRMAESERIASRALKDSPEAEKRFLEGHEEGKRAYAAGDFDTYDLDELEKQLG